MNLTGNVISNIDIADNADIRRAITKATPKARMQAKRFAGKFKRSSEKATCRAIFDFLKSNLKYVADGDHQVVQLPSALLRNRRGDCKSYSVFTSAVLSNLGIPHHYVYASYTANPTPGHIYVVTDSGIIIDAVYGTFNAEKPANYKYPTNIDGTMRVSTIAGVGACCASCENKGVGFLKRDPKKKAERQQKRDDKQKERDQKREARKDCGPQGLKPVTLSAGRNLFLLIVQSNLDGLATKFSTMDQEKLRQNWCNVGGNPQSLFDAIRTGSSRKSKKLGLLGRLAKAGGVKINGAFIGATLTQDQAKKIADAVVPAAIAAGTAVGVATGQPAQGAAGGVSLGAVIKGILPIITDAIIKLLPDENTAVIAPPDGVIPTAPSGDSAGGGDGGGKFDITNILLIAGGLAAAYFVFKK